MPTSKPPVLTEIVGNLLIITLNHPKVNALTLEMIETIHKTLKQAGRDEHVRSIILTHHGPVFSAGHDLREVERARAESFRRHLQATYNPLILQIRRLEKPVLAAINGSVSGAALGIALACDLRIATAEARFLVGFLGIGLVADAAVSLLLPTLIGLGRASEHTFLNEPINAQQALEWGMVNRIVPAERLDEEARSLASSLANGPVHAMGLAKRAYNKSMLSHLEQVLDYEAHLQEIASKSSEHQEGLQAFLEKRQPQYITS